MAQFTFDDEWAGNAGLFSSPKVSLSGKTTLICCWEDFSKEDVEKIKEMEQQIFEDGRHTLLERFKEKFSAITKMRQQKTFI